MEQFRLAHQCDYQEGILFNCFCVLRFVLGTEGRSAFGHQQSRAAQPVAHSPGHSAAFLRRHVRQREPNHHHVLSQGEAPLFRQPNVPSPLRRTDLIDPLSSSFGCSSCHSICPSLHPGRERRCVCLTTGTHCSPLPLPKPTLSSLLSAPKYVLTSSLSVLLPP